MAKKVSLILPNQLFFPHPAISKEREVLLYEHPFYFTAFTYHCQKIIFHRATLKVYFQKLKKAGYNLSYISYKNQLSSLLRKKKIQEIHCCKMVDQPVENDLYELAKKMKINIVSYDSPMFLSPYDFLKKQLTNKKKYLMGSFYKAQRKRMGILLTKCGRPVGGKWSYDELNRRPLPKDIKLPKTFRNINNAFTKEAISFTKKKFPKNLGESNSCWYPVTHTAAKQWLKKFLCQRFKNFGTYQDAITSDHTTLFHSILSPLLNVGLLTPAYVVEQTKEYATKHKIPTNSYEGFMRQLIGWREFVWGVYLFHGNKQRRGNFFKHRKKLQKSFYQAKTGIGPVDTSIKHVLDYGYAHHIERLMVLGNIMLLTEIHPQQVYKWFMEMFIDAYDWVMVPNVFGMSQYADGGIMTTKPYFSGSNYILKMSDFGRGEWSTEWDALYWRFIDKHKVIFKKNRRWAMMVALLKRMNATKKKELLLRAKKYLSKKS